MKRTSPIGLADIMYALSDPARLEIIRFLSQHKGPLTCSELNCNRPKSSMSHHFKILRESGIVETRIEGKEHFNSLNLGELDQKFPGLMKVIVKLLRTEN